MRDAVGCKESRFVGRRARLLVYVQLDTASVSRFLDSAIVWCTQSAHPCVENKLRNAIAKTTEFLWRGVARCGAARYRWIQREKKTTWRCRYRVEGRAKVTRAVTNVQKTFWPESFHASVGGIRGRLPTVRGFPCECARIAWLCTRETYAPTIHRPSFSNDISCRELK